MSRPDGRIEKGQRLTSAISARAWNRAQDAADIVLGVTPGTMAGETVPVEKASNIVLVQNNSGQPIPILGVLKISGVVISPAGGDVAGNDTPSSKAREFVSRPVATGAIPENTTEPIAVALEPIPVGSIGRCACGGMFAARVHISNANHMYAGGRNGDVTQLASATCGPVRLMWKESSTGSGKWAIGKM